MPCSVCARPLYTVEQTLGLCGPHVMAGMRRLGELAQQGTPGFTAKHVERKRVADDITLTIDQIVTSLRSRPLRQWRKIRLKAVCERAGAAYPEVLARLSEREIEALGA